jgi:outer membrane protein assembly factor BamB
MGRSDAVTNHRRAAYVSLCVLLGTSLSAAHAQWPQFRGPNGSGVDTATGYPVTFSPSQNVVWKTGVPYGQSSPVLAGGHVYLTAAEADRLLTICLDRATGRELWRREIRPSTRNKIFRANDPASPSPAADEAGVVVFFPDAGLVAYTPDGKDRWALPLGPFKSFYGMAASPILAGDLAVLVCDQQSGSFLIAVDRRTGQVRWKQERTGAVDAYATPMVFQPAAAPAQLIVLGSTRLDAYSLSSGEQRWWMPIGSSGAMGTAVAAGDRLYIATAGSTEPVLPQFETVLQTYDTDKDGRLSATELAADKDYGEHFGFVDQDADGFISATEWAAVRALGVGEFGAIAIRPGDARGKLEPAAVLWRFKKNMPYIPAPLLHEGVFYMVKDGGIITSLDAETGQLLKEGRSPNALGGYYASPVAADHKVFLASTDGKVTVLQSGGQWQVLGVNDLGDEIHSTPALAGGRIYIRTRDAVYCFGSR